MDSTDPHKEVKAWLHSMVGQMIAVLILQKSEVGKSEQVIWEGQGKVLRCVQEGVVLDLNTGGSSWWSRFLRPWYVVPHGMKKPLSVPYRDLAIDLDQESKTKRLVIDAATWKRSPDELQPKDNPKGSLKG